MTISNSELVGRFFRGEYNGIAANMEIATTESDGHIILGYRHAVYAYAPPDGRFDPVVFVGWKGASKSTTRHIRMMESKATYTFDGRARKTDVNDDPDLSYLHQIGSDDKDYSTAHTNVEKGRRGARESDC